MKTYLLLSALCIGQLAISSSQEAFTKITWEGPRKNMPGLPQCTVPGQQSCTQLYNEITQFITAMESRKGYFAWGTEGIGARKLGEVGYFKHIVNEAFPTLLVTQQEEIVHHFIASYDKNYSLDIGGLQFILAYQQHCKLNPDNNLSLPEYIKIALITYFKKTDVEKAIAKKRTAALSAVQSVCTASADEEHPTLVEVSEPTTFQEAPIAAITTAIVQPAGEISALVQPDTETSNPVAQNKESAQ
jgi:hypothetical protein